jgi:hypothetical protein
MSKFHSKQKVVAGFCIYCGKKPPEVALTKEHVIAKGLGGLLTRRGQMTTLHEASCGACAKVTRRIESTVIEYVLDVARNKAGIPRSKGGAHPTHYTLKLTDKTRYGLDVSRRMSAAEYPIWGIIPIFTEPPCPPTRPSPTPRQLPLFNLLLGEKETVDRLPSFEYIHTGDGNLQYLQMLCKIAHSYCHFQAWREELFESYLLPLIFDPRPTWDNPLWGLLGSSSNKLVYERRGAHLVAHTFAEVDGRKTVRVHIRLFAMHNGSHTVEVIAGHLLPKTP